MANLRSLFTAVFVTALATPLGAAKPASAVHVMVVGTYHFDNPGRDVVTFKAEDVLKPRRQRELERLATALAAFRPTRVMTERQVADASLSDPGYAAFTAADMARHRGERVQIAYRLADILGLKTVEGIDEQPSAGEPDYFPFPKVQQWAAANGQSANLESLMATAAKMATEVEQLQAAQPIAGVLAEINRPERAAADQEIYYSLLRFGGTEAQPGADLNAMWYLRNAKIFAKLMTVAKPGDRIVVVYGSGHVYWLRHFAATTPGYVNVDPTPYLERATR